MYIKNTESTQRANIRFKIYRTEKRHKKLRIPKYITKPKDVKKIEHLKNKRKEYYYSSDPVKVIY